MKKTHLVLSLVIIFLTIQDITASFDSCFHDKTLRMDYYHSGNSIESSIQLYRFIEEPFWAGSKRNLTDTFGYGRFYFEVQLASTGEVIYSRGYSTLFVEWQDTEEAKEREKSFNESLIMPFPKQQVIIEIFKRDKKNILHSLLIIPFDPASTHVLNSTKLPYTVKDIQIKGPTDQKLDVVFIAEGYTESEQELFVDDCHRFAEYLLGCEPFATNRAMINIRGICAISEDSGASLPEKGIIKKTAVGASFYTFGTERYLMAEDFHRVRDIAGLAPYDQIFIIVNSNQYGGGGIFNFYATGTRGNIVADFLLIHEFGHSFAGLADEYYTSEVAVDSFYDLRTEPWEPNITTLVDFGSKWADMIGPTTPVPTPAKSRYAKKVGVYEGGGYLSKGIYRPYIDCSMKSVKYDAFCPVCRRAITRMIRFYSD